MRTNVKLGMCIEQITNRNTSLDYSVEDVFGISNNKVFMETKARPEYADLAKFYIIGPKEFVYNPRTSRNGEKVGMGFNIMNRNILTTFNNIPFKIKNSAKNTLDPDYLYLFFLNSEFDRYARYNSWGSATELFSWEDMCNIELNLPDILEQRQIVEKYETVSRRIELLNNIVEQLRNLRKKVFDTYYWNKIKDDWDEVTLADITSKFATGLNPRDNFVLGYGDNYYVTIKNMSNDRIYLDDKCDRVDDAAVLRINMRSDLKVGDVLFSGIATIGRVALITEEPNNWNISESIFTLRPKKNVSSEFLMMILLTEKLQDYAEMLARGSAQRGIRMADLKAFKIKKPDYDSMIIITKKLTPIFNLIEIYEKELDYLNELSCVVKKMVY